MFSCNDPIMLQFKWFIRLFTSDFVLVARGFEEIKIQSDSLEQLDSNKLEQTGQISFKEEYSILCLYTYICYLYIYIFVYVCF